MSASDGMLASLLARAMLPSHAAMLPLRVIASRIWTAPIDCRVTLAGMGAGGSGGGGATAQGGGSAGWGIATLIMSRNDTLTFTMGAGGAGKTGSGAGNGSAGGMTTIIHKRGTTTLRTMTIPGGGAGLGSASQTTIINDNAGGVPVGFDIAFPGSRGGNAQVAQTATNGYAATGGAGVSLLSWDPAQSRGGDVLFNTGGSAATGGGGVFSPGGDVTSAVSARGGGGAGPYDFTYGAGLNGMSLPVTESLMVQTLFGLPIFGGGLPANSSAAYSGPGGATGGTTSGANTPVAVFAAGTGGATALSTATTRAAGFGGGSGGAGTLSSPTTGPGGGAHFAITMGV